MTGRRAYDDPAVVYGARERWHGVDVIRIRSSGFGKGAKWRRLLDSASFLLLGALRALFVPRPDVIIALTSPPMISFIGACLARLRRARFIYWIMDLNPEEAVAAGWLRAGSLPSRLLEWMSRFSLRSAHSVIVLDRFMCDRVRAKGIQPERVTIIPPWAHDDVVRFDEQGRIRFRNQHALDGRFVIMYSGNHSPCHPLTTVLEAARALAKDPAYAFCFVGGGSEHARVRRYAVEHDLRNIICLPYQPLEQLAGSLSAADLHVVVMGDPFVGIIHPCKIYNILAVAAPVLYVGPTPSHLTDILQSMNGSPHAYHVAHGEVQLAVAAIQRAAKIGTRSDSKLLWQTMRQFSRETLLPSQIALIERLA